MISFSIKGQLHFWRIQTNSLPSLDIWVSMLMKGPLHFWRIQTPAGSSNKLISRCCCQKTSKTKLLIRKFSRAVDPPKVFTGTKVFLFTFVQKYSLGQCDSALRHLQQEKLKLGAPTASVQRRNPNASQNRRKCLNQKQPPNKHPKHLQCCRGMPILPKTEGSSS